eukprot:1655563-Amphidinium_carterae.1
MRLIASCREDIALNNAPVPKDIQVPSVNDWPSCLQESSFVLLYRSMRRCKLRIGRSSGL